MKMRRARTRNWRCAQKVRSPKFEGEVIRDARGREVVCFTTPSGVRAIVDTSIPDNALARLIAKLRRKIHRRQRSGPFNKA